MESVRTRARRDPVQRVHERACHVSTISLSRGDAPDGRARRRVGLGARRSGYSSSTPRATPAGRGPTWAGRRIRLKKFEDSRPPSLKRINRRGRGPARSPTGRIFAPIEIRFFVLKVKEHTRRAPPRPGSGRVRRAAAVRAGGPILSTLLSRCRSSRRGRSSHLLHLHLGETFLLPHVLLKGASVLRCYTVVTQVSTQDATWRRSRR